MVMSGKLKSAVEFFLQEFNLLYESLEEGSYLSQEQENGLLLGTLLVGKNDEELLLTPFHPLNLAYQLQLCKETEFENATDIVIDRLNSIYLLPYIKHNKKIYKVSDQMYSMEWKYYAPVENRKYRGSRRYVPKLIEEKITEFISHFKYIFSDINNKTIRINLINMGDCSDVFNGIAQYFIHAIGKTPDVDQLMKFQLHIYSDGRKANVFENIKEYSRLKAYLTAAKLSFANGVAMNSLEGVLSKNIECYFHKDVGKQYKYAHGILSHKNLGFEKGPTSDDLLFIGLNHVSDQIKIYLYPTEVKTGINANDVIKKAFQQVSATATGLQKAMNPEKNIASTIMYKVNRNFLMQLLVTSCKKMKVYHVDDSQNWEIILDKFRLALLNEDYVMSTDIQEILGRGSVLSFRQSVVSRKTSFKEDTINFIEMPEKDEFNLILSSVDEIHENIRNTRSNDLLLFEKCKVENLTGDVAEITCTKFEESEKVIRADLDDKNDDNEQKNDSKDNVKNQGIVENGENTVIKSEGMKILFGVNQQDGSDIIWEPNNTDILFHTNTGIIGTMGTGKTQFTKSLITQLYLQRKNNIGDEDLGILIFDYKGDYNESKHDFIDATNATILKPYQLPFNPLSLTKSKVFKPLLPIHTANAFKDTISKVYGLGPKQQDTLFQCIIETYAICGIQAANPSSWDNEAPTFEQVYQTYANDEDVKKNDSLAAAMNKLHQFQVFENNPNQTKPLFDILHGVVVIDLSGYDSDIQSLIVAITLDLFYVQMQAAGSSKLEGKYRQLTKLILVDEADNFMSEGFSSLKKILKEGREFGVGTILSTQFLKHFGSGDDDYAKYILTWIVHNVADLKTSDVDFVFKSESKSLESQRIFNDIKQLKKHYSIVKISSEKPKYIRDRAFWELYNELKSN